MAHRLGMITLMRAARLSVLSQLSGGCLLLAPNGPDFIDAYTSLSAIDPSRRAIRGERFLGMITLMRAAVFPAARHVDRLWRYIRVRRLPQTSAAKKERTQRNA